RSRSGSTSRTRGRCAGGRFTWNQGFRTLRTLFGFELFGVLSRTDFNARLTACEVGNAFASSGSSTTNAEPGRARRAYLPRTPFSEAKSYSGLIRSSGAGHKIRRL